MAHDERIKELAETVEQAIAQAFHLGRETGQQEMKSTLLQSLGESGAEVREEPGTTESPRPVSRNAGRKFPNRAPRGTVSAFLRGTLDRKPGLTWSELRVLAERNPVRFSYLSISNELHQFRGVHYREDDAKRWYLIGKLVHKVRARSAHEEGLSGGQVSVPQVSVSQ